MSDTTRRQITAWIEEELAQQIQELANAEGRSFSNMVEQLCKRQVSLMTQHDPTRQPAGEQ